MFCLNCNKKTKNPKIDYKDIKTENLGNIKAGIAPTVERFSCKEQVARSNRRYRHQNSVVKIQLDE